LEWNVAWSEPLVYAINQARDLGPELHIAFSPIKDKAQKQLEYSWIPVIGPIIGAIIAALYLDSNSLFKNEYEKIIYLRRSWQFLNFRIIVVLSGIYGAFINKHLIEEQIEEKKPSNYYKTFMLNLDIYTSMQSMS